MDTDGNFCPTADNKVNFKIDGPATIAAVGNGNSMSYESFRADHRKAFNGLCLLVVRSERTPGKIEITASSDGLQSASLTITATPGSTLDVPGKGGVSSAQGEGKRTIVYACALNRGGKGVRSPVDAL